MLQCVFQGFKSDATIFIRKAIVTINISQLLTLLTIILVPIKKGEHLLLMKQ